MGKVLLPYLDFSTGNLISRASSGISTMAITNSSVNCTNILLSGIKTAIGESSSTVTGLSTSANANKWSNFGPHTWDLSSGVLTVRHKTPYQMGNFAGYNHSAVAPYIYDTSCNPAVINQGVDTSVTISCKINLGEISWRDTGAYFMQNLALNSYVSNTSRGVYYSYFNPYTIDTSHIQVMTNVINVSLNLADYITSYLYFADVDKAKICDIPDVSSFKFYVQINERGKLGNINLSAAIQSQYPDWMFSMNDAYVTQYDDSGDTYYLDFTAVYDTSEASYPVYTFDLFAQLNSGSFQDCSQTVAFDGNGGNVIVSGNLPFEITYGDIVNFELQ